MPIIPILIIAGAWLGIRAARRRTTRRALPSAPIERHGVRMYHGCSVIEIVNAELVEAFVRGFEQRYPHEISTRQEVELYFMALLTELFPQCANQKPSFVYDDGSTKPWDVVIDESFAEFSQG